MRTTQKIDVFIAKDVLDVVHRDFHKWSGIETLTALFGYWEGDQLYIFRCVDFPDDTKTIRTPGTCSPDIDYQNEKGEQIWNESKGVCRYVGYVHKHPTGYGTKPSGTDHNGWDELLVNDHKQKNEITRHVNFIGMLNKGEQYMQTLTAYLHQLETDQGISTEAIDEQKIMVLNEQETERKLTELMLIKKSSPEIDSADYLWILTDSGKKYFATQCLGLRGAGYDIAVDFLESASGVGVSLRIGPPVSPIAIVRFRKFTPIEPPEILLTMPNSGFIKLDTTEWTSETELTEILLKATKKDTKEEVKTPDVERVSVEGSDKLKDDLYVGDKSDSRNSKSLIGRVKKMFPLSGRKEVK